MSLLRACDHRTEQDNAAWYLYELVEQRLYPLAAQNNQILEAADISAAAGNILKRFDATAYVKYLSYHQPRVMDAKALRKQLRGA